MLGQDDKRLLAQAQLLYSSGGRKDVTGMPPPSPDFSLSVDASLCWQEASHRGRAVAFALRQAERCPRAQFCEVGRGFTDLLARCVRQGR